jgi:RNA polymerase sigma factor (TIGR02999 family)
MAAPTAEITTLLCAWRDGDAAAFERLLPLVYDELHRMAHRHLRGERPDHTLDTTALVHEAYLKLVDAARVQWQDRAHFLAMASRTMRRILVDWAHARNAAKRGGGARPLSLDATGAALPVADDRLGDLLDLDDALTRLEALNARAGQALAFHYFGGLTQEESAAALGVSVATVERDLRFARAWLAREWQGRAGT